ncbi:hypothetical protein C0Z18_11590 [Trinickia dabaoshanensis]|uniref:Abi-like protein n=1 Tax=Trinickia dabaoshanensis TaxID=564714 RepID=A0A2N7VSB5_9BURK|nr:hypothetical protein C0Z18_11590 [Trinickia dabaoshanensis]
MHRQLSAHFGRADWWDSWAGNRAHQGQFDRVQAAYSKLRRRREPATADKVVAELTFGFWATLLNVEFQHSLRSPLRKAFPHCPKPERQLRTISAHVNTLRDVRNRAFHHEPVLWLAPDVDTVYTNGLKLVSWIHGPLETWLVNLSRVRATWTDWKRAEAGFAVRNARKSAPHAT